MLPIEIIRERINNLRGFESIAEISNAIKSIFKDVIYCGDDLYLITQDEQLYYSSINGTGKFLRLYTHKDLADNFIKNKAGMSILNVSIVETVQLAKTFLLRGGNGFILNEGDKWISISFTDYLELFFRCIKIEEDMFSRECADIISCFNEINEGNILALMNGEQWADIDGKCYIFSKDTDASSYIGENSALYLRPCVVSDLFKLDFDLCGVIEDNEISYSKEFVYEALSYCGYDENEDLAFVEQVAKAVSDADWHIADISLNFHRKTTSPEAVDALSDTDDIAFSDLEEENDNIIPESFSDSSQKISIKEKFNNNFISPIKDRLKIFMGTLRQRFSHQDAAEDKKDSYISHKAEPEIQPEHTDEDILEPNKDNIKPVKEVQSSSNDMVKRKAPHKIFAKLNIKPKMSLKTIGVILLILAILGGAGIFIAHYNHYNRAFDTFCNHIDNSEYGSAYAIYNEENLHKEADEYLRDSLNKKLLDYARDEINLEELKAAMQSLSNFPALQQDIEVARLTSVKLENSKEAYRLGNEAVSVYEKLDNWRQVIELDAINYVAVQESVKQKQSDYEAELKTDIEYYSTRIREYAKERYEVLAYWYPESETVSEWFGMFQSDSTSLLSIYPVVIYGIDINQGVDSYWSVTISWKNKSVKTIKSIRFSLVAVDEKDNIIECSDYQGSWTVFDALDPHRYGPGEGSFDKDYRWSNAFYGSRLAGVRLTGIYIEYTDGSTASYINEEDLVKMQE